MSTVWSETLLLMGLGMGTVFVFLLILILSLTVMSAIIKHIHPVPDEDSKRSDIAAIATAAYRAHIKNNS